jgi:Pentapeptide repeats (8 copies)
MKLLPESALFICAAVIALAFIWFCGWDAKRRLAKFEISEAKDKAELDDGFRKTTAQILGAAAVIIVFAYTFTKDDLTFEQARSQSAASTYSEGTKLLKETDPTVRAAGIYLVEKVGALEPQYHDPISRTLVEFIKQKTPQIRPAKPEFVGPDVKAAIHVLGRTAPISDQDKYSLTLDETNLAGADFAWLSGFRDRHLQGADLRHANFQHADLREAWLNGSVMNDSGAYGPDFTENVPRRESWGWEKYRYAVQFDCADLSGAHLTDAGLVGVLFGGANMNLTNLHNSNISRADFTNVRNLDKVNFGSACADDPPRFPDGFVCELRRCPPFGTSPPDENQKICHFEKPQASDRDEQITKACRTQ